MDNGDDTGGSAGASAGRPGPAGAGDGADEDFRALAEDWIAIWQSEITAYLTDPETQASWTAMIALWAEAAQAMLRGMPAVPPMGGFAPPRPQSTTPRTPGRDRSKPAPARPGTGADAAAGAASTAAASDPRDDEVRRLEQRVSELERHLAGRDGAGGEAERRRGPAADGDRRPRGARRRRS